MYDAKRFAKHIQDCHEVIEQYRHGGKGDFDDVDFNFDEEAEVTVDSVDEEDGI